MAYHPLKKLPIHYSQIEDVYWMNVLHQNIITKGFNKLATSKWVLAPAFCLIKKSSIFFKLVNCVQRVISQVHANSYKHSNESCTLAVFWATWAELFFFFIFYRIYSTLVLLKAWVWNLHIYIMHENHRKARDLHEKIAFMQLLIRHSRLVT